MVLSHRLHSKGSVQGAGGVIGTIAQPMPAPLRIGVLTDMSGVYSEASGAGSVEAARMAAEEAGGVLSGRRIEVLSKPSEPFLRR